MSLFFPSLFCCDLKDLKNDIGLMPCLHTPLHRAAKWGRDETVATLIAAQVSLASVKDVLGLTPLHWACAGGHVEVVKLLLPVTEIWIPAELKVPSPFQLAAWGGHLHLLRQLLDPDDYVVVDPCFRGQDVAKAFQGLASHLEGSKILELVPELERGIDLFDYVGMMQMRKERLPLAAAWFDVALRMNPINTNVRNPRDIVNRRKVCDNCYSRPIRGLCFTCTRCIAPFYDLCENCFTIRSGIGHIHDNFLQIPTSKDSFPTVDEQIEILETVFKKTMED